MEGVFIKKTARKSILTGLMFSFFFNPCFAQAPSNQAKSKPPETRELMEQFLTQLIALKSYFVSEEKFVDPQNSAEISLLLKKFAEVAKKSKHDPVLNQDSFKFSRHVLEDHITDTERVFRLGSKSYARWKLKSTVSVCMSCHSQVPTANRSFGEFGNSKMFSSEFDQAEFLFATRAFDKAYDLYDKVIEGFPKNSYKADQVKAALERQVAFHSRLQRDPTKALAALKKHQKNKNLPKPLIKNIAAWISQFETWDKQPVFDPKTATDQEVVKFAKRTIEAKGASKMMDASDPNLVNLLRASGILFEYLQSHPRSSAGPEILYWLSVCDRSINNTFFYSLADLYLRECILKHPGHPIAKKCYNDYEEETTLGYTGSSGTNLPAEVRSDLNQLKKLVETGGKVELREN